jgi:hypothetical protein
VGWLGEVAFALAGNALATVASRVAVTAPATVIVLVRRFVRARLPITCIT